MKTYATTATIGAVGCDAWRGNLNDPVQVIDLYTRPGIDGVGNQQVRRRAVSSSVTTEAFYATAAEAKTAVTAANASVGSVVAAKHPTTGDCKVLVLSVNPRVVTVRGWASGVTVRLTIDWTVEVQP